MTFVTLRVIVTMTLILSRIPNVLLWGSNYTGTIDPSKESILSIVYIRLPKWKIRDRLLSAVGNYIIN